MQINDQLTAVGYVSTIATLISITKIMGLIAPATTLNVSIIRTAVTYMDKHISVTHTTIDTVPITWDWKLRSHTQ